MIGLPEMAVIAGVIILLLICSSGIGKGRDGR